MALELDFLLRSSLDPLINEINEGVADNVTAAATSATNAASSATAAATSATSAGNSASTATTKATQAGTSATNAASSATAAATSATSAGNSASTATTKATEAANSATAAATSATNAGNSATAAATSATNAGNSASTATTKATEAANSATAAANSATAAATSATNAGNSATAAATSATNAGNSASTATTKATEAANSATSAGQQATIAQQNRTRFIGAWAGNTAYLQGDGVIYGNTFYRRKADGNSIATFDVTAWDALAIGINNRGAWAANTVYLLNDLVVFRGSAYLATTGFTSGSSFTRANWTRITRGWQVIGAWAATTQYYEDDIVTNAGNTYMATADHVSGGTFSASNLLLLAAKGDPGTLTASAFTDVSTVDDSTDKVVIQSNTTLKRVPRTAILTTAIDTPDLQKSLNLDFVGSGSISRRLTVTRSGILSAFDRQGNAVQFPANIPAIGHDFATGKRLGLSSFKGTENKTNNSSAIGGAPGTLGSGGTLPTGWTIQNVTGLTLAVAYGVEFGMSYIEFTATGTATGATASVIPPPAGSPAATKGQIWTTSTFVRSLSGSAMFSQFIQEYSTGPGQGYIAGQTGGDVTVQTALTRLVYTVTIANVSAAYANAGINLRFTVGQTYNQTVRIYAQQFELSDVVTPWVPTPVGATATRGDETITLPATNLFSQSEGCIVFQAIKSGAGGRCFTLASAGGAHIRLAQEDSALRFRLVDDVGTTLSTIAGGNLATGSVFRAVIAWAKDDFVLAINGTLIGTANSGAIPAFATLTLGNIFFPFNSYIQKIQGYARRGTNAQAIALSRL